MKKLIAHVILALFLASFVAADLSVQLKRTNPGIAGEKGAELIFDIVNTDLTHKIEGFLWCQSPDDSKVSSSFGAGSGSGAQYVSPLFVIDKGPSQKAMNLMLEADSPGDKSGGCSVKYIPFKEEVSGAETKTEPVNFEGSVGVNGENVGGFVVKLVKYTPAVEAVASTTPTDTAAATTPTTATAATPANVIIDVDGVSQPINVGEAGIVGVLTVKVLSATEESASVIISGTKETKVAGTSAKQYLKMNSEYVSTVTDGDYRILRLDKSVPFASKEVKEPACPEGKDHCKSSEVIDLGSVQVKGNVWPWVIGVGIVLVLLVFYLMGKTSRRSD